MRKLFRTSLSAFLLILVSMSANAQNQSDQAKTFFASYQTSESMGRLIVQSLPTLEDCKTVFKGENAGIYFRAMEEMKSKSAVEPGQENETFADIEVDSFSTADIEQGNGNYAGGMARIADKLQSGVIFYKVSLLREKGDEYGLAYKYWVNIHGRWVFFPKPYSVFPKPD